jgi:hypothetical protein
MGQRPEYRDEGMEIGAVEIEGYSLGGVEIVMHMPRLRLARMPGPRHPRQNTFDQHQLSPGIRIAGILINPVPTLRHAHVCLFIGPAMRNQSFAQCDMGEPG